MTRIVTALLLVLLPVCPTGTAGPTDIDDSLARFVPRDVGLYVEGRGIADVILPFIDPQAWLTLAEFAGQPAAAEEAALWRQRLWQTLKMPPAEAVRVLLGDQFAIAAEGPLRAQDCVVLCRPTTDIKTLLKQWHAQPLPTAGRTSLYRLPNRVGLAQPSDLLLFGDAAPADSMFRRLLEFSDLDDQASLADDPAFGELLARVPARPDAVLFMRLVPADAEQPTTSAPGSPPVEHATASMLPAPLRGAANALFALHRSGGLLHFSAVGDGPDRPEPPTGGLDRLVSTLPRRTFAVWGLHVDHLGLLQAIEKLPTRSVLRIILELHGSTGRLEGLTRALAPPTCLAVGVVEPASRTIPAPPVPAVAILIATTDPEVVDSEMLTLLETTASICNLAALRLGSPLVPPIEHLRLDDVGVDVCRLDLSELIRSAPGGASLAELHLCWATDGDALIIASHIDWLHQILLARHHRSATLDDMLNLSPRKIGPDTETIVAVQTGPIADLGLLWLSHLERTAPDVLHENWWRTHQPGGDRVQLGIQVSEDPERKVLHVNTVTPGTPADGLLKPGDDIFACEGQRFATSQPISEIRDAILSRPHPRWLDIDLERDGTTIRRRLPLPFVDPVQMLRRAIAVGRIAQRFVYHDQADDMGGARGVLTVEPREPRTPALFPLSLSPQTTSQPAAPERSRIPTTIPARVP
ncbi:MAG: hypothetical protein PVJ57_22380 [Phycisphaerae bacterium]|jgi:hypothetical protein